MVALFTRGFKGTYLHYLSHLSCDHQRRSMERFTNTKLSGMSLINGLAEENARAAETLHRESYPQKMLWNIGCLLICLTIWKNMGHYKVLVIVRVDDAFQRPRYPTRFVPCMEQNVWDTIRNNSSIMFVPVTRGPSSLYITSIPIYTNCDAN
ncbi:hypothetical protein TNCV_4408801 [Trichonephila clavipes]|nr:hypothetical protein TNCV_4408801 [Trichonephila clavipes]